VPTQGLADMPLACACFLQSALVEAFRSLAQHLTWADQNDPQMFDQFVELRVRSTGRCQALCVTDCAVPPQMLAHFSRVLAQCGSHTSVAVQLLQTLCILVLNTSRATSLFYLCSNNYLDDVLTCADKQLHLDAQAGGGTELLAWYISFLKAVSLRLDAATIQFFVTDTQPPQCRLYAHAMRYIRHGDALVRVAARAAVLNVLKVHEPRVLQAAMGDTALRSALCHDLCVDAVDCVSRVGAALVTAPHTGVGATVQALPPPWSHVSQACEELGASTLVEAKRKTAMHLTLRSHSRKMMCCAFSMTSCTSASPKSQPQ